MYNTMTDMEKEIRIVKRDGVEENFKIDKITKILEWACEGIEDVVPDHILYNAKLNVFDGIKSSEIHQIIVESAASLIDKEVNYTKVAASLMNYKLRKEVWGGKNPPKLYDLLKKGIKKGFYDPELIKIYTKAQINKLDEYIKHDRDSRFEYGGLVQLTEKYLVQNRNTKEIVETPQFAYMMASMALCIKEAPRQRVKWVKEFYDDFSNHKINVSTPIMSGARTRVRSYSSCCIIDVADTKHSITSSVTSSVLVTADKYGIGLNYSKIRSINEPIRGGEASHGGVIPWLKLSQAAIQASQQGPRRGAGTCTFFAMHPEIETILQLKDTLLPEDRKVEHLDYSIAMTNLFYHRLLEGGDITLCSYNQAPDVYKAYGTPFFNDIYEKWELENPDAPKITTERFFSLLAKQRSETARIYIYNIDENFTNSAWLPRVEAYNLCQEVGGPTKPERFTEDPEAETVVCVLSAPNACNIKDDADHKRVLYNIVRILDNVIDVQEYTVDACKRYAENKRSLGVGISNLTGWLALQGLNHSSIETPQVVSDFFEKQQYYLIEASIELAKERGKCKDFNQSKYSKGIMPVDRYNKNVHEFLDEEHKLDWDRIRAAVLKYGMRHCTLSSFMPCEASSVVQSSTNGFEPIRDLVVYKESKTAMTIVVAPNVKTHGQHYVRAYDAPNNDGYIKVVAVLTKWSDMGVSGNLYYNPAYFEGGIIPQDYIIQDILTATRYGWRTFYYHNTDDGDKEVSEDSACASGACSL
jgi:ribonucleoside-diphosphate reductase alpha chain